MFSERAAAKGTDVDLHTPHCQSPASRFDPRANRTSVTPWKITVNKGKGDPVHAMNAYGKVEAGVLLLWF
jgi:hypothetical protein